MESEIEVLKQLVSDAPILQAKYKDAYIKLLEERDSQCGYEENGFVYNVRPSIQENYNYYRDKYNENSQQILDLCKKLDLSINYKSGLPDLSDIGIKPYGLSDKEKYKLNKRMLGNSPVDLPYGY